MLASPPVNEHALAPSEIGAPTILPPLTKAWTGLFTEGQQRKDNSSNPAFLEAKDLMATLAPPIPRSPQVLFLLFGFLGVVFVCLAVLIDTHDPRALASEELGLQALVTLGSFSYGI